jgi:hypothetical protein
VADDFTGTAGVLADGELELAVLSTRAATVTGGDAVFGVRGLDEHDDVVVTRNGDDVTDGFAFDDDGVLVGLVDGFVEGDNLVSRVGRAPRPRPAGSGAAGPQPPDHRPGDLGSAPGPVHLPDRLDGAR